MRSWKFIFVAALAITGSAVPFQARAGEAEDEFNQLPEEIILEIFSWLDESSLCSTGSVNRLFCKVASSDCLWKRLASCMLPESIVFQEKKVLIECEGGYGVCFEKWAPKVIRKKGITDGNIQQIELQKIKRNYVTCWQIVMGRRLAKFYKEKSKNSQILDQKNLGYLTKAAHFGNEYAIHELCKAVTEGRYKLETDSPENVAQMLKSFVDKGSITAGWYLRKFLSHQSVQRKNDSERLLLKKELEKWVEVLTPQEAFVSTRQRAQTF